MKIVINTTYGGYYLTEKVQSLYCAKKGITERIDKPSSPFYWCEIERNDPVLVEVIEQLKEEQCGDVEELKIVEIPDDVEWRIHSYDGKEHVAERHRTWY